MENISKSSIDILKEEVAAEAASKAAAEAVAKTKLSNSIEIAKKLLGKLANADIANATGLSISQIEQLRVNT